MQGILPNSLAKTVSRVEKYHVSKYPTSLCAQNVSSPEKWQKLSSDRPRCDCWHFEEQGQEEKGMDQGTGVQKPLAPSFLPAWLVLGSTAPDIWGGGNPPAPVFRMWA